MLAGRRVIETGAGAPKCEEAEERGEASAAVRGRCCHEKPPLPCRDEAEMRDRRACPSRPPMRLSPAAILHVLPPPPAGVYRYVERTSHTKATVAPKSGRASQHDDVCP